MNFQSPAYEMSASKRVSVFKSTLLFQEDNKVVIR